MSDTTMTRPDADPPVDPSPSAQPAHPACAGVPGPGDGSRRDDRLLPWWGFAAATTGRLWLALVTGALLIATIPAVLLPGWSAHVVVSDSMSPRINTGDVVLSQDRDAYQVGQVIVFDDADRGAVTHRLQSVEGDVFTTKGDANPTSDSSPVTRDDVLGLGRVLVMFAGLPWVWFHTGQWLALALFILSLLLASWAVARDRPYVAGPRPMLADPRRSVDVGTEEPALSTGSEPDRSGGRRRTRLLIPVAACAVAALAFMVSAIPSTSAAFSATTTNSGNTWTAATAAPTTYAATILGDSPYIYLRLNEPQPGNVATLRATDTGPNNFTYQYTRASTGNFSASFDLASASSANMTPLPNTSASIRTDGACILPGSSQPSLNSPQTFTIEAWIRTAAGSTQGGKIIGFENSRTTTPATQYDRHLYMDGSGYVHFGIWTGAATTLRSSTVLNDGAWHHVVGTLDGAGGTMRLYVDGAQAGQRAGSTAQTTTGWWRFGCGYLNGWTTGTVWSGPAPAVLTVNQSFIGLIDEPAVYRSALTATQALAHYNLGKP